MSDGCICLCFLAQTRDRTGGVAPSTRSATGGASTSRAKVRACRVRRRVCLPATSLTRVRLFVLAGAQRPTARARAPAGAAVDVVHAAEGAAAGAGAAADASASHDDARFFTQPQHGAELLAGGSAAYKGVWWRADKKMWRASWWNPETHKIVSSGCFATQKAAALWYDAAVRKHGGTFVNFPDERAGETQAHAGERLLPHPIGSSGFRGVIYAQAGRIRAKIDVDGRAEHLGAFASEEDATRAYDCRARELGWPAARLNFPHEMHVQAPAPLQLDIARTPIGTSGFRGVALLRGKHYAQIWAGNRQKRLGAFDTAEAAARAYDAAARELGKPDDAFALFSTMTIASRASVVKPKRALSASARSSCSGTAVGAAACRRWRACRPAGRFFVCACAAGRKAKRMGGGPSDAGPRSSIFVFYLTSSICRGRRDYWRSLVRRALPHAPPLCSCAQPRIHVPPSLPLHTAPRQQRAPASRHCPTLAARQ
jgi:hypothetical protein